MINLINNSRLIDPLRVWRPEGARLGEKSLRNNEGLQRKVSRKKPVAYRVEPLEKNQTGSIVLGSSVGLHINNVQSAGKSISSGQFVKLKDGRRGILTAGHSIDRSSQADSLNVNPTSGRICLVRAVDPDGVVVNEALVNFAGSSKDEAIGTVLQKYKEDLGTPKEFASPGEALQISTLDIDPNLAGNRYRGPGKAKVTNTIGGDIALENPGSVFQGSSGGTVGRDGKVIGPIKRGNKQEFEVGNETTTQAQTRLSSLLDQAIASAPNVPQNNSTELTWKDWSKAGLQSTKYQQMLMLIQNGLDRSFSSASPRDPQYNDIRRNAA